LAKGLNTAFSAMRRLKLKEPTIAETESAVVASIRYERMASPEELVLKIGTASSDDCYARRLGTHGLNRTTKMSFPPRNRR
jgi:hypothetical protein